MIKNLLIFSIALLTISIIIHAQPSSNMRLITNLNQHAADGQYSACWGYVAPNGREYGILGCAKGTSFIDITDTNNILEVDYVPSLDEVSCCRK